MATDSERGIDMMNSAYQLLDIVPNGRDEDGFDFPMNEVAPPNTLDALEVLGYKHQKRGDEHE